MTESSDEQQKIAKGCAGCGCLSVLAIAGLALIATFCGSLSGDSQRSADGESKTLGQQVVDRYEIKMRWDCERAIKDDLRDPKSYEAHKIRMAEPPTSDTTGAVVRVMASFRARNAFGGMAAGLAECYYDQDGERTFYSGLIEPPSP